MSVPISDARAIELFTQHRKCLRDFVHPDLADYPKLFQAGRYNGAALLFQAVADDALRDIPNSINELGRLIQQLQSWREVYLNVPEDEKYPLLVEFIRPVALLCLIAPYSIKGRIQYAACNASHHANIFLDWSDESPRPNWEGGYADAKKLKTVGSQWPSLSNLLNVLDALDGASFREITGDFRKNHHHRLPHQIEMGIIAPVRPVENEPNVWSYGYEEPLSLEMLIPALIEQHSAALEAYGAFVQLLIEQNGNAPLPHAE